KIFKRKTRTSAFKHVVFLGAVAGTHWTAKFKTKFRNQPRERDRMKLDTLRTLYIEELRDLYNAESQLLKALPKMAKAASSEELKNAFEKHLKQTEIHVERLEDIFQELDQNPKGKTCYGMKGLVEEGSEILKGEAIHPFSMPESS